MSKEIELTKGYKTIVDDSDYEWLSAYSWCILNEDNLYAVHKVGNRKILMHREILDVVDKDIFVDHIDCNKLNNRRNNLRTCTFRQNMQNKRPPKTQKGSKYKGVGFYKNIQKYYARIKHTVKETGKKESIYLGNFDSEIEAAKAYNEKALELFGEFAYLNDV
jgi:hypothetical protein